MFGDGMVLGATCGGLDRGKRDNIDGQPSSSVEMSDNGTKTTSSLWESGTGKERAIPEAFSFYLF